MKEKGFNLKEERRKLLAEYYAQSISLGEVFDRIKNQDKEFIRLLKDKLCNNLNEPQCDDLKVGFRCDVCNEIDKLAGDKLK